MESNDGLHPMVCSQMMGSILGMESNDGLHPRYGSGDRVILRIQIAMLYSSILTTLCNFIARLVFLDQSDDMA